MLAQVKSWSDDAWDALAVRSVDKDTWLRAVDFRKLFGTPKIYKLTIDREVLFRLLGEDECV